MRIQKIEKNKVFLGPIKDTNVFFETNLSDSKSGMPPKETIAKEEKKIGSDKIKIIGESIILFWKT